MYSHSLSPRLFFLSKILEPFFCQLQLQGRLQLQLQLQLQGPLPSTTTRFVSSILSLYQVRWQGVEICTHWRIPMSNWHSKDHRVLRSNNIWSQIVPSRFQQTPSVLQVFIDQDLAWNCGKVGSEGGSAGVYESRLTRGYVCIFLASLLCTTTRVPRSTF